MKALILAGGFGTRLRPLTANIPKPFLRICGRSMLEWQIEWLINAGVRKVVLAVSRDDSLIRSFVQMIINKYKIEVVCSVETEPLNTGGAIKLAENHLRSISNNNNSETEDHDFYVLNADVMCDFPFKQMMELHKSRSAEVTVLVTRVDNPARYGIVVHDPDTKKVEKFVEKPQQYVGDYINAGLYIFNESMLDHIELRNVSLEREIFPQVVSRGGMYVTHNEGFWDDVGVPHNFILTSQVLLKHFFNNKRETIDDFTIVVNKKNFTGINLVHKNAYVDKEALVGPFCVIHEETRINKGARVCCSTIEAKSVVGENAHVFNSILAQNVRVGQWTRLDQECIIAENSKIESDLLLLGYKADPGSYIDYLP